MDSATSQAALEAYETHVVLDQKQPPPPPPPPFYVSLVDPFLVEALQNSRHRLTILRMELDVQKFVQNFDQQQFVFPHFPTSYLRLAAHRVAQHYCLQTMVRDNGLDGQGCGIVVIKKPDSKFPAVLLSDVPAKELENGKHDQMKIVIRPRASKGSSGYLNEMGIKRNFVRTLEERTEEYDRARARIFSSSTSLESEDALVQITSDRRTSSIGENEVSRNLEVDGDKNDCRRDHGSSSRVAIFRDREKDRTDPDYDRSYERYVKSFPSSQNFGLSHCNMQQFQPPFVQYDSVFPQPSQIPAAQASLNYSNPSRIPYCSMGMNPTSRDAFYVQWQMQSMMYAQSYDQMRPAFIKAPSCQPLSSDYSQNLW